MIQQVGAYCLSASVCLSFPLKYFKNSVLFENTKAQSQNGQISPHTAESSRILSENNRMQIHNAILTDVQIIAFLKGLLG